ncbi:hypothetical protein GUJ93_ZPchr0010g10891 [Zizania palustris]|uniref:Uncharacterized protein n=1 Tax=Zizania palustris TaxID=103762 RepID=A0A8J5WCC2_ZIZPA|nr:hypothetical protein GUJ93_ZPchr0010g10891 [Zizania palustris]
MEVPEAMVLEILATDEESPMARLPPRIRRRLLRAGGGAPTAAEEIEAKFSEAHLRRSMTSAASTPTAISPSSTLLRWRPSRNRSTCSSS